MNSEIKQAWVEALESGEYEQTHGRLRREDGFCCLGVLCELAVKAGVIEPAQRCVAIPDSYIYPGSAMFLPIPVSEWAELDGDPEVELEGRYTTLSMLNDERGLTFPEIAEIIKEHL